MARDPQQEHELLRHKMEREAAAKETDTVRQNEKEFAKGIPAGLLYGTAAGFAWIGDRLNWLVKNYKNDPDVLMPALEDLVSKHLENKSEAYKQGFDFGDVASMFGGPEDLVKAGATTVLSKMAKNARSTRAAVKHPPIVKLREEASRIEKSLPPVEEGKVRLWRGNRRGGKDTGNPSYTDDLAGIALPFRRMYGGDLTYVDVPKDFVAGAKPRAGATDSEFILPKDLLGNVKRVPSDTDDELADLVEAQARDAKRWASQGGTKAPIEVREAYKEMGVDYEKVIPEPLGVSQPSGFTARNNQAPVDEAVAAKGAVKDRTMTAHTQSQANPMATSGMPPPDSPPNMQATVEEGAGIYAAKQTAGWDKGWSPEGFKAHVNATIYAKADAASKGKGTAPPEFWVYDEKAKELIVVKRKDDGSLYIGKAPKRPKIVVDTGIDGEPIYSDKIDLVVPEGGEEWIRKKLYESSMELLDKK